MKDYMIVEDYDRYAMVARVKDFLSVGWQCQGGVSVIAVGFRTQYSQAMVKP